MCGAFLILTTKSTIMKVIPGSNPAMYIEENGAVKDQHFSKVPHEYDEIQKVDDNGKIIDRKEGDAYVKVAGKKRYVAAIQLETNADEPRKARSGETFRFKDDNRRNFAPDNLEWYKTTKADPDSTGQIKDVGEAGKVDSKDVPVIKDEEPEAEPEVNKKELIQEAFLKKEDSTYQQVIDYVKETHKVDVSQAYVAKTKKELGLTGK